MRESEQDGSVPTFEVCSDPVTHAEMQDELRRLRSAVVLLANACGAHIIGQHVARELERLLAEPGARNDAKRR